MTIAIVMAIAMAMAIAIAITIAIADWYLAVASATGGYLAPAGA